MQNSSAPDRYAEVNEDGWRISYSVMRDKDTLDAGELITSVASGLVDKSIDARNEFRPTLIYNDNKLPYPFI